MNKRLLTATLLLAAATHLLAPTRGMAAPAGTATARYNPSTGTLVLDIGAGLGVLGIESIGNFILGQTYSPPPQSYDRDVIAYYNPAGFPPQVIRLENALVTGLTPDDILFGYVVIGGLEETAPVTIPEPSSAAAIAIGLLAASRAARRRVIRRHE